jgi:two-component sensor histidine kinase
MDPAQLERSGPAAYAAAVIITVAAIGVRLPFLDLFQGYPFVTIFPAVILSAFVGGRGPGLATLLLGGLGAWFFFVPDQQSFFLKTNTDLAGVLVYALVAGFMVWAVTELKAAVERERLARLQLAALLDEKTALLQERELLLTEIRHRVGNNLQQITGLLRLHARQIIDPEARAAFDQARARIDLFAEVHQGLYRTGSDKVNLQVTLTKLVTDLVSAHRPVGIACRVVVSPALHWPPERAVPVIMVTQELVCNALEHGFGDDGIGTITVSLGPTESGLIRLMVADNGRGLPAGADPKASDSLGLSIVRAFARQLGGTFTLHPGDGGHGSVGQLVFGDESRLSSKKSSGSGSGRRAA